MFQKWQNISQNTCYMSCFSYNLSILILLFFGNVEAIFCIMYSQSKFMLMYAAFYIKHPNIKILARNKLIELFFNLHNTVKWKPWSKHNILKCYKYKTWNASLIFHYYFEALKDYQMSDQLKRSTPQTLRNFWDFRQKTFIRFSFLYKLLV